MFAGSRQVGVVLFPFFEGGKIGGIGDVVELVLW
jgi:hypothetical protein